ncbi:MAG: prepilin-type N-terminal cleavage/methylation domain-containing protein [Puniceicoccales bacterium]|jgi:prepilin-type N-terminal cleavage/methylation domain-containing protein|nr:prepilin-type N-terminal cleavage/methylation domain-containing protein [Puniceicoccales bacterium]
MENKLTSRHQGFTLLEILVSLFLIAFISTLSFYLFTSINNRYKISLENAVIDSELRTIGETLAEDLSCMILIDKGFPIFEFAYDDDQQKFFISFFSSNNEEHITKAIQYCIKVGDDSRKIFTKSELSPMNSLFMQNNLDQQSSLRENFSKYVPAMIRPLSSKLLNFSIRVAMETPSGGTFLSSTNANLTYKNGCLYYKNAKATTSIEGTPLFVDITARALSDTFEQKLSSMKFEPMQDRAMFLALKARKIFRRIVIKSRFF